MNYFENCPTFFLPFLILVLLVALIFQSINVIGVFMMELTPEGKRARKLIEIEILFQLIVEMQILLDVTYDLQNGGTISDMPEISVVRYLLYAVLMGSQMYILFRSKRWQVLLLLLEDQVLLPPADDFLGLLFPYASLASVIYLGVRAYSLSMHYNNRKRGLLTGVAIKQAMDLLPSGVLVVDISGRIIFMNDTMQMLLFEIMGKLPNDFYRIYWHLMRKTVKGKGEKIMLDGKILYNEKTKTYWMFQRKDPQIKNVTHAVFVASDITEQWNLMLHLQEQTKILEKQSRELEIAMSDMEEKIREQEIIELKGVFHDVLGQKIALLLRALREKEEPEEELLREFLDGIPEIEDIAREKYEAGKRLEVLVKTFDGIGVTLKIDGRLPSNADYAGAFTGIIQEASTNAVRHGYAKEICVVFEENQREYRMKITNDGITPEHTMLEGNGIKGMRKKIMYAGGYLMIDRIPEFAILAIIPKEMKPGMEQPGETRNK